MVETLRCRCVSIVEDRRGPLSANIRSELRTVLRAPAIGFFAVSGILIGSFDVQGAVLIDQRMISKFRSAHTVDEDGRRLTSVVLF